MGVRRFRSVEEMPGPPPLPPLAEGNLRLAFDLMDMACRLRPMRRTAGVRKFRSVEEADASRRAREAAQIRG